MNKQFPWGIVVSLVAIVLISLGGAYLLYRIINEASPFKPVVAANAAPARGPTASAPAAVLEDANGFLVMHLRASVEMSPDSGDAAFDLAVESKGYAPQCPGKTVTLDHRLQAQDYWSEEEGAISQADSVICLPAPERAAAVVVAGDLDVPSSSARTALDDDDANQFPDATVEASGKSVYVHTGRAGYMLYVGGVAFKSCAAGCDAGAAAGVSVTKVKRAMSEDRFLFNVPAGDSKTVSVAAIVPVTQ